MTIRTRRKPIVHSTLNRDQYQVRLVMEFKRAWDKLDGDERLEALQAMASVLDSYADQMRTEAQEILP